LTFDRGRDWPAALGVAMFAVAMWAQTSALVGVFYDDGIYTVLAKALAEGRGYHYIHLPGAPPAVHYPILYPLVLSVLWRIWPAFPANVALFQLFDSAALGAAAWVVAVQARAWGAPRLVQFLFIPAAFLAFPLLTIVGVRFSEPFFLALSVGAVACADREDNGLKSVVLAGILAGLATLTRSIGVAVIVGVVAGLWIRRGYRSALPALAAAGAMVVPWFVWVSLHAQEVDPRIAANYGSYAAASRQAGIAGILAGLDMRAFGPPARLLLPAPTPWIWQILAVMLFAALVWGATRVAPRAPSLASTLLLYVGVVTFWPFTPDRFMWIMLPWMFALAGWGIVAAWQRGGGFRWGAAILGLAIIVGYVPREARSLAYRSFAATAEGISLPSHLLLPSIKSGVTDSAVVAAEGEALVYLYTGRQSVPNALFKWKGRASESLPPEESVKFLCDSRVNYIALSGASSDGAPVVAHLMETRPQALHQLFKVSGGPALYRFECPA
jgi:hypothetical protein